MNKAFFIDKDGTLIDNSKYPEVVPTDELMEDDVLEGLKHIQSRGYKLIIISNQPCIAKRLKTKEEVEDIFKRIVSRLKEKGIYIDDYFYCPHQSSDNCDCKKPSPTLILQAAKKHNIDLSKSFIMGDMDADIIAGKNAGLKSILVLTGRGKDYKEGVEADYTIKNTNEVKNII